MTTPAEVSALAQQYEFVDLRFPDLPGKMHHFTIPSEYLKEETFEEGLGFDGSSIRGFQSIEESDMLLIPDPTTAYADPFYVRPTLVLNCFIKDPISGDWYYKDPRRVARNAEEYLISHRSRRHLLLGSRGGILHLRHRPVLPGRSSQQHVLLRGGLGRGRLELDAGGRRWQPRSTRCATRKGISLSPPTTPNRTCAQRWWPR